MRNWDSMLNNDFLGNPNVDVDVCPQEKDYNDAKKVAEQLGIELYRIDFVKEYWDNVFTYFLDELKKGRTPNPDVMCNKYIKFDLFKKERRAALSRTERPYVKCTNARASFKIFPF